MSQNNSISMEDTVRQTLVSTINLANQVIEAPALLFKQECDNIKIQVQKLLDLLKKALTISSYLCEPPTRHVISIADTVLHKSLYLVDKCISNLQNRFFTIIPVVAFRETMVWLERSINDISWLLNISNPRNHGEQKLLSPPPFSINDPTLFLIYEPMAILYTGTLGGLCEAARSLRSLASDNPRNAETMVNNGLCSLFVTILEQGSTEAQAEVVCAMSALVSSFPESQNVFTELGVIQLVLSRLVDSLQMKAKAMAAQALTVLARGNSSICRSITDSKRFLRFQDLLEIEDKEVKFNSLMVLVEITAMAEEDSVLRHSAFKAKSPVFKSIVNQTRKLIEEDGDTVLLIPHIRIIGSLARTFRASDRRMIEQLVNLLGHQDPNVSREAIVALAKFASPCNYLHKDHSRAIVEAGGAKKLVELSYSSCEIRILASELLIRIAD